MTTVEDGPGADHREIDAVKSRGTDDYAGAIGVTTVTLGSTSGVWTATAGRAGSTRVGRLTAPAPLDLLLELRP